MNSIIVPEEGTRGHVLQAIPGAPPNLKLKHEGCRFEERCKYKAECQGLSLEGQSAGAGRVYKCRLPEAKLRELYKASESKSGASV
jgi:peptide/nickel transport system ATP-binding protein